VLAELALTGNLGDAFVFMAISVLERDLNVQGAADECSDTHEPPRAAPLGAKNEARLQAVVERCLCIELRSA
jgi:hypothetical protein